ncbi:hypothetical protein EPO04_01660 [Patescibacteria group bacterium]|nr:MAG: hypothetical protein EPO04_01660 [Patescibacteria group bacterium]
MWWLLIVLAVCFAAGTFFGAPYLPIKRRELEGALDLAELQAGETLIDLGSGDGTVLIAAARRGANAIGYELNPLLWLVSYARTWPYRRQVSVRLQNYWMVTLPPADVIYTFLLDRYMAKLNAKLESELSRPTRVVCHVFELPRKPISKTRNSYLYRIG